MKLISCHIEGFGRYSDTDFSFEDGLNCFVRENGGGKTTLTAFLRAMLYGMDGYRCDARGFPDRMHYYPWGKGGNSAFGGNIVFEKDGSEYRIERFFGEKNAKDDRMTVYRNGFPCTELGECPGKTIFGLDSDSFARTVFFMCDDTAVESSEGINRALTGMLDVENGRPGAEEAASKLREKAYEIRAKSRKIGFACDVENEIFNIKNRLFNLKSIEDTLERRYALRSEYERSFDSLKAQKKQIETYNDWLSKKKVYEEKLAQKNASASKLDSIYAKYPEGIPDSDTCMTLSSAASLLPELRAKYASSEFPPDRLERLSILHNSYPQGFPKDSELEELGSIITDLGETEVKIGNTGFRSEDRLSALDEFFRDEGAPEPDEYEDMREEADLLLAREKTITETAARNPADTPEYKRLCEKFCTPVPADLTEKLDDEAKKYVDAENRLQQLITEVSGEEKKKFRISWIPVILMLLSVLLLGAGVILLLMQNPARVPVMIVGASLLVVSASAFGIDSWLQNRVKGSRDMELMSLASEKKKCSETILSSLADYSYFGDDPLSLLNSFKNERNRYLHLKTETEKCSVKLADLKAEADEIRTDIDEFLGYHGIQSALMTSQGLRSAIDRSEQIKNEYKRLCTEKSDSIAKLYVLNEHKKKLLSRRHTLLSRYGLSENCADSREALSRLVSLYNEFTALSAEQKEKAAKRQELSEQISETLSIISGLFSSFGFDCPEENGISAVIHSFSADRDAASALKNELSERELDCEKYRIANIPKEAPAEPDIGSAEADSRIDTVLRNISTLEREIEGCENEASLISGYEEKLREAEEKLRKLDEKRKILLCAADAIEGAERSIKEKYIAPIREKFSGYATKLGAVPGSAFSLDDDFNVSFEAAGAWHRDRSLSAGQQVCCSLALRMSLIESIYEYEKPFLIFDDPFSGLDTGRLEYALSLLKKLGKDYQILYFCCHESRAADNK